LAVVALATVLYDRLQVFHWVGSADLTIEFLVTDAETGEPIQNADILIHSEGGFYEERHPRDFRLRTDSKGAVRYVCRRSMSFGNQSGLRFTDTFNVHLPWWFVGVAAPGYQTIEPFELEAYHQPVKEVGPRHAKLIVPIALHKSPP